MNYDAKLFSDRVTKGEDGVYRWIYRMNPRRNKHPVSVIGKALLAMAIPSALALFIVGSPMPRVMPDWEMPLMAIGLFLGMFLLITGLLYLQGDDPLAFAMDGEKVMTYRAKAAGPHVLGRVRRVRFMPQHDAIRLAFGVTLYVPKEDYGFVRAFLLEHLPRDVQVR